MDNSSKAAYFTQNGQKIVVNKNEELNDIIKLKAMQLLLPKAGRKAGEK